ncbi:MAG TPA: GNAT family protein [Pedobacter sp.]|jgi:RimJ/RimL family protein N-acetyltransferase
MLKVFEDSDFPLLESWITDADLLLQFSGTDFNYPITLSQLIDYKFLYPERKFYIGYTPENIPFAFGEIIPQNNSIPRLGRVLIGDPSLRGRGHGKYFTQLLVDECKLRFSTSVVELLVWNENKAAINCYRAIGFVYCAEKEKTLVVNNRSFDIHRMTYTFSK